MFKTDKLSNGMKVITRHMDSVRSFSIGVWVKVGSNDEQKEKLGITHLIEHMLFKGTQKRTAKDIAEVIDAIGGSMNAFTSKDCTAYYAKVLTEDAPIAIDVLSDMLLHSTFDASELKKEIKVVKEEIAMYEDSPEDVAYELLADLTYPDHPLGWSILGTPETVSHITRDDILAYMNDFYVSGNIILACAGFLPENLLEMLEEAFAPVKAGQHQLDLEMAKFSGGYRFADKDIEQHHLVFAFEGITFDSLDYYALLLLSNFFGGTSSSKLFQKIREDHGLTYSIYSHPTYFKHSGSFSVYLSYQPENHDAIIPLLIEELNALKNGIDEDSLRSVKNQLRGSYLLGLEGSSSIMNILGKRSVYDAPIETMEEIMARIESITTQQVQKLIDDLFKSPLALVMVGKLEEALVKTTYDQIKTQIGCA
mgnify:CR=1 FL=1